MSHIFFIHKDDLENYENHKKAREPLEKEEEELWALDLKNEDLQKSLNDLRAKQEKQWLEINEKHPYRFITLGDPGYSNARENGYIGFYRGFRWDR